MTETALQPNILIVMCDQLSALATSPYGNDDVITPNLDDLADHGTLFENAYCNAPLCAPSRASMMTGRLPATIPVNDNAEELPATVPTFAHCLRRAGYKTILSGKMHFVGPDQMHGFEERLTTDIFPAGLQWVQQWKALGDPPRSPDGDTLGFDSQMILDAGPVTWSTQLDYDEEVHFRALERIRQLSRRNPNRARAPWMICVSYTQPHDPYAPAREYWDRYEGRDIHLPDAAPPGYEASAWDRWVNAYHGVDKVNILESDVRRARRSYYAMVSYIDDKLGELRAELARFGQSENTVVIFLSDHGDMLGEHGMFFKRTFREWSTRIPLIIAGPHVPTGRRDPRPVSLVDLFPTISGLADIGEIDQSVAQQLAGRDLFSPGPVHDEARAVAPVIIDYNGEGTIAPTRTVIQDAYKYVYVDGQDEQLFNLETDPNEWTSLAGEPELQPVLQRLREVATTGWDPIEVSKDVVLSQNRRTFIQDALGKGITTAWDYRPSFDGRRMYVRQPIIDVWDHGYTDQPNPFAGAS